MYRIEIKLPNMEKKTVEKIVAKVRAFLDKNGIKATFKIIKTRGR